jgi:hypothetical protein
MRPETVQTTSIEECVSSFLKNPSHSDDPSQVVPRRVGLIVLASILLAACLLVPGQPATATTTNWWSASYDHRFEVAVLASSSAVPSGYSVSVTLDHAALVTAGRSLASGNDVRIAKWNGSAWTELDRVLDRSSSWNDVSTKLWFRTTTSISASTVDTNYYVYYGNSGAGSPPANAKNVYDVWDDFSGGVIDTSTWYTMNTTGVTISQTGGELRLSGTNTVGDPWKAVGLATNASYASDYSVDVDVRIVAQSATAQANRKLEVGLDTNVLALKAGDVSYWNGATWVPVGTSTLGSQTFGYQHVQTTMVSAGIAQVWENGVLRGTRSSGLSTPEDGVRVSYGPDVMAGNETFDVRFDNVIVRKFVADEPMTILSANRDVAMEVVVEPTLTVAVGAHAGTCNGVAQTAGSSATGTTVVIGNVTAGTQGFAAQDVNVTANAGSGFSLFVRGSAANMSGPGGTIANVSGSNAAPVVFPADGNEAFGYTTNATLGSGTTNRFTSPAARYAPLTQTNQPVGYASGPGSTTTCLGYRFGASATTAAGAYASTIIYTVVPIY